ncbi:hypothetical protein ACE0DR_19480 [Azotobacter sp. CWF10]
MRRLGHGYPQDAGELSGHARHAALQPVAAMLGDALGDLFHQPRLVPGDYRQYQMIHSRLLLLANLCPASVSGGHTGLPDSFFKENGKAKNAFSEYRHGTALQPFRTTANALV